MNKTIAQMTKVELEQYMDNIEAQMLELIDENGDIDNMGEMMVLRLALDAAVDAWETRRTA